MKAFYLNSIPGYREALTRARVEEFRTREDNWLALNSRIAGLPVRVMTVRDYIALLRQHSPFLCRREPTFEDLGNFLWTLSPQIEKWHNHVGWRKQWLVGCRWSLFSIERWQMRLFAKRLRRMLHMTELEDTAAKWFAANPGKPFEIPDDCWLTSAISEAFAYMDRVFFDRPSSLVKSGDSTGLHYLTSWFDIIQSEYKKTDEEVYRMPIPQLFGRIKAIQQRHNPKEPDFNSRQDALNQKIIDALTRHETTPEEVTQGRFKLN